MDGLPFSGCPHATRTQLTFVTSPSRPVNDLVRMFQSRSQPSWCELDVRRICGQYGHSGWSRFPLRRLGQDLELVHLLCALAVCRAHTVDPVSPPPITSTVLFIADICCSLPMIPAIVLFDLVR